jgi:hypothetical protein
MDTYSVCNQILGWLLFLVVIGSLVAIVGIALERLSNVEGSDSSVPKDEGK